MLNCGQSCVAPEYVLAPPQLVRPLANACAAAITAAFGDDPSSSPSYGRLISPAAVRRVAALLVGHGGQLVCGGQVDAEARYVSPTVLVEPRADSAIMQEEVFGPCLCILPCASVEAAVRFVRRKPTPLSLYLFTTCKATERLVLDRCPSGTATVNDCMIQPANPYTPFGGLGPSGMGAMHGRDYFECCTQRRGVMTKANGPLTRLLDMQVWLRMPPYCGWKNALIRVFLHPLVPALPARYGRKALGLGCALAAGALLWALHSSLVCAALAAGLQRLATSLAEHADKLPPPEAPAARRYFDL